MCRVGIKPLLTAGRAEVVGLPLILALSGSFVRIDLHVANGICFHSCILLQKFLAGVLVNEIEELVVHRLGLCRSAFGDGLRRTVFQVVAHQSPADRAEGLLDR